MSKKIREKLYGNSCFTETIIIQVRKQFHSLFHVLSPFAESQMGEDKFLGEDVHSSDGFARKGVEEAERIGDFQAGSFEVIFGGEF